MERQGCVTCVADDRQPRTHIIYSLRPGGDAGSMASRDIRELPEWVRPRGGLVECIMGRIPVGLGWLVVIS